MIKNSVDASDFSMPAAEWLQCNDPMDPGCEIIPDPDIYFCGDGPFPFKQVDMNMDCYVNINDLAIFLVISFLLF